MNIQIEKLDLIEWIAKLNDSSIIKELSEFKSKHSQNIDIELHKEELESIERGLKDLKDGKVHSHESARNVYAKYL